jgi:RNA recognition motif-containing protein
MDRGDNPAIRADYVASTSPKWSRPKDAVEEPAVEAEPLAKTTMMFRNLPDGFTRLQLEELLDAEGFAAQYDFIYLPADLSTGACFGYAFVNIVTPSAARSFMDHFQGFDKWPVDCDKRAVVHTSEGIQGRDEQVERYRNSPLMHESVSDDLRPAIYRDGARVAFPESTVPLKPPRARAMTKRQTLTQKMASWGIAKRGS